MDANVAAAVERAARVVGGGDEGEAIGQLQRQLARARERGARIGVGVGGAAFRSGGPGADLHGAEADAARRREPGEADAARGPHQESQKDDE